MFVWFANYREMVRKKLEISRTTNSKFARSQKDSSGPEICCSHHDHIWFRFSVTFLLRTNTTLKFFPQCHRTRWSSKTHRRSKSFVASLSRIRSVFCVCWCAGLYDNERSPASLLLPLCQESDQFSVSAGARSGTL